MRSEFEKHFLSLKFATEGSAQRCLDSCTFDSEQDAYLPDVNWISDNDADECVIYCCMLNTSYISFKDQQSKVDELQKRVDAVKGLAQTLWEKSEEKHQRGKVWESKTLGECADEILDVLEQALNGGGESKPSDKNKPA